MQELAGDGTKELNLEGKVVVPGFIDSHVHLIWGGLQVLLQTCYQFSIFFFFFPHLCLI